MQNIQLITGSLEPLVYETIHLKTLNALLRITFCQVADQILQQNNER
jgi:hypothetical protein